MLELKNITKDYKSANETVHALKGITLSFRENEFVSVLGQSGCGKTTLLNIIGGLDQYTSGDLIINGRSTKDFKSRDWDDYRNHSIGFVFQSYNLIPHQNVLSNVELALTLSGVSKEERRKRARDVLEKVGLSDQLYKKPNQMSGGQMQRALLGRAIISEPDAVILDEPNTYIDKRFEAHLYQLLDEINHESAVILVSHDIGSVLQNVRSIACVDETLDYHPDTELPEGWLENKFNCPIDLVGHGNYPHRVLKCHKHG